MKIARFFLPGKYEDAHIGSGYLTLLTQERSLRRFKLGQMDEEQSFTELLDERRLRGEEMALDIPGEVILDLRIYNQRAYIGADSGFYQCEMDWDSPKGAVVQKRLDATCFFISAKGGAVAASCGGDGLFVAPDDFAIVGTPPWLCRLAEESARTSWLFSHLINYGSGADVLFRVHSKQAFGGIEGESDIVIEVEPTPIPLERIYGNLLSEERLREDGVQFTASSTDRLFMATHNHRLHILEMESRSVPTAQRLETYPGPASRVLSMNVCHAGLVFETYDQVLLFAHGTWTSLMDSEVLTVRTFPTAKRYENLITMTTEEGVHIVGLLNDLNDP